MTAKLKQTTLVIIQLNPNSNPNANPPVCMTHTSFYARQLPISTTFSAVRLFTNIANTIDETIGLVVNTESYRKAAGSYRKQNGKLVTTLPQKATEM